MKVNISEAVANVAYWDDDGDPVTEQDRHAIVARINEMFVKFYGRFHVGIVTALSKELAAVKAAVDDFSVLHHDFSEIRYYCGKVTDTRGKRRDVVFANCATMGNSASAILTTHLLSDFPSLDDVIMVGIAGGVPNLEKAESDVRVGDIVVSTKGVVQYDLVKLEPEEKIEIRSQANRASAKLTMVVQDLESKRHDASASLPWELEVDRISGKLERATRPGPEFDVNREHRRYNENEDDRRRSDSHPVIHYGVVGSASTLLKSPKRRDALAKEFKVLAIEMEGSGVADATWLDGVNFMIVRGICDYCDDRKNDAWQMYAACLAAGYAISIIKELH